MSYYDTVEISASGLSAERLAMDVIANNIANANTTRTPQGGAFKRQLVIFAQKAAAPQGSDQVGASGDNDPFAPPNPFDPQSSNPAQVEGVQVLGIQDDQSPDRLRSIRPTPRLTRAGTYTIPTSRSSRRWSI